MPSRFQGPSAIALLLLAAGCSRGYTQAGVLFMHQLPNTPAAAVHVGAGMIGNNAGSLVGTVLGPAAGIVANNAGSLVSDKGIGLISNNAGSLISNNAGSYRVQAANALFAPLANARVTLVDAAGKALTPSVTTDAQGRYTLTGVPSGFALAFVQASATVDGQAISLLNVAAAPTSGQKRQVGVDPATTLASKKVARLVAQHVLAATGVTPTTVAAIAQDLVGVMSAQAVAAACLQTDDQAAQTFDAMVGADAALASALEQAGDGASAIVAPTPTAGPTPAPPPVFSGGVNTGINGVPPSPVPTPTPSPSGPALLRLAGCAVSGDTDATGDLTTATFRQLEGIVADATHNRIYVADSLDATVRVLHTDTGLSARYAGNASAGFSGDGGAAASAQLNTPLGLALTSDGSLYVADNGNHRIRKVSPNGIIITAVGGGTTIDDGSALKEYLGGVVGLAADASDAVYFTDRSDASVTSRVRRLNTTGTVTTLAKGLANWPGPICVDSADHVLWFGMANEVDAIAGIDATPTAPVKIYTATGSSPDLSIQGLAYNNGALYVLQSSQRSSLDQYGLVGTRVLRIPVDTTGQPTGTAAVYAGSGASGTADADYLVPTHWVSASTTLLPNRGLAGLTVFGADLLLNASYYGDTPRTSWAEVLKLQP